MSTYVSSMDTFKNILNLIDEYWRYPENHKHMRMGQFLINEIEKEDSIFSHTEVEGMKSALKKDWQYIYYTENNDEAVDFFTNYFMNIED